MKGCLSAWTLLPPRGAPLLPRGAHLHMPCGMLRLQQMDNAVYTFETLLHQELGKGPTKEELCKSIQRILERVLKVSCSARPCPSTPGGRQGPG